MTSSYKVLLVLISGLPLLVTLIVNPWSNFEPVAVPKLFLASLLISVVLVALGLSPISKNLKEDKLPISLLVSLAAVVLSLAVNHASFSERLFGVFGRSTGAFHYLFLVIIAVLYFLIAKSVTNYFFISLAIAHVVVLAHSILQWLGWDFYEWVLPTNNKVFSTLGNPNILSSFLSFSSFGLIGLLMQKKRFGSLRVSLVILNVAVTSSVIIVSGSALGLISLLGGLAYFIFAVLTGIWEQVSRQIKVIVTLLILALFFSLALLVNRSQIISFQGSILRRLEFWQAGISIFKSHPFSGIGFDRYADFFTKYFPPDAGITGIRSSSAHNFWIDILASGGVLLFTPFLIVQLTVLIYSFRSIRRIHFSNSQTLLKAAWIAFSIQSFISVQSLAIGLWGWAMTGMLLSHFKSYSVKIKFNLPTRTFVSSLAVLIFTLNLQSWKADFTFNKFARLQDGNSLIQEILEWPQDSYRIFLTAEALRNASQDSISTRIEQEGIKFNSANINLLRLIVANETDESLRRVAQKKLKILDPTYVIPTNG